MALKILDGHKFERHNCLADNYLRRSCVIILPELVICVLNFYRKVCSLCSWNSFVITLRLGGSLVFIVTAPFDYHSYKRGGMSRSSPI